MEKSSIFTKNTKNGLRNDRAEQENRKKKGRTMCSKEMMGQNAPGELSTFASEGSSH